MRRDGIVQLASALVLVGAHAAHAEPISRKEILTNADAFTDLSWKLEKPGCSETCPCPPGWQSDFAPGNHVGVPYKWGGDDDAETLHSKLKKGLGAGSHKRHGVLACTTGQDCSGFVSRVWGTATKYSTSTIDAVAEQIDFDDLRPGDALNKKGSHIVLFAGRRDDGVPIFYEASGSAGKVRIQHGGTWAYLNGYRAIRYRHVQDREPVCEGTKEEPIRIAEFPFSETRSMFLACSDRFARYSCKPQANEAGREYIYTFEVDAPGVLEAKVASPKFVDVDLHLLSELDENACLARADKHLSHEIEKSGRYFLVADTFTDRADVERSGPFDLKLTFAPRSSQPTTTSRPITAVDPPSPGEDSCGCRTTGEGRDQPWIAVVFIALLGLRSRRS